jgi:hypothetical protein
MRIIFKQPSVVRKVYSMSMRRLGALIVIIAVVAVAGRFAMVRPVSVELELDYGGAAPREADLVFTRDDHVERELRLVYPEGAAGRDRRAIRLRPGHYTVGVRLVPEKTLTRSLDIEREGTYTISVN